MTRYLIKSGRSKFQPRASNWPMLASIRHPVSSWSMCDVLVISYTLVLDCSQGCAAFFGVNARRAPFLAVQQEILPARPGADRWIAPISRGGKWEGLGANGGAPSEKCSQVARSSRCKRGLPRGSRSLAGLFLASPAIQGVGPHPRLSCGHFSDGGVHRVLKSRPAASHPRQRVNRGSAGGPCPEPRPCNPARQRRGRLR